MSAILDKYFEIRQNVVDYYNIDPMLSIEDMRDYYWFMHDYDHCCYSKNKENLDIEFGEGEHDVCICSSVHVRNKVVKMDNLTFLCIDNDCGSDPYYIILDDNKKLS